MRNKGEGARRWRQNDVLGLEKRGIRVKKSIVDVIINFDTEKINISRCPIADTSFFHIADTSNPVEFVVNRYRDPERTNLGTQFARIVKMSGIGPIPRPFDNMRASRSTEIYVEFGAYLESEWIGHSSKVAHDHYLQVREEDFERASGRAVSGVVLANQSDCDEHAESCREKPSKVVFPALEKNFPAVFPAARNGNERYGAVAKK